MAHDFNAEEPAWALPVDEPARIVLRYADREAQDWFALVLAWAFVILLFLTPVLGYLNSDPPARTSCGYSSCNPVTRQMNALRSLIPLYRMQCGAPPPSLQALLDSNAAGNPPGWAGPYLASDSILNDTWGRPYRYQLTRQGGGDVASIRSAGPDGVFDNPDDLTEKIELGP